MRARGAEPAIMALARASMARGMAALAANDRVTALRWLDRAHRIVPQDPNTALTLASACLGTDPHRAVALFASVAEKHDVKHAWLGLAAARLRLTGPGSAAEPLAAVLSRHAFGPDTAALAEQIAGGTGWCAMHPDGRLEIHTATPAGVSPVPVEVKLDGKPVRGAKLPAGWARGRAVEVRQGDRHLLGSPIRIDTIRRLAGCVEVREGGVGGWAWHPGDPGTAPVLTVICSDGREQTLAACDEVAIPDNGPLARTRGFHLGPGDLRGAPGPIHVRGPDGNDLPGSPLDPFADAAFHAAAAARIGLAYPANPGRTPVANAVLGPALRPHAVGPALRPDAVSPALRADAAVPSRPVGADRTRRAATVVIPVHNGGAVAQACLASVLASEPEPVRVLVVDDASTDPVLVAALDELARQRKITLLRHTRTLGFPASANAGIRAARGRDVVLLNSDTLVPFGWLQRLRQAAYAAPDIGTVTPLSNHATILSYPGPAGTNPRPDQVATDRLDRLAARANGNVTVDVPVGVGFCLYLRRDCLNATGVFRADVFAQGYGEENDLCLRARHLGWRNVALTGLFVGHLGGASFGGSAIHLRQRNSRIVEQLHPGHQALIDHFLAADPLAEARRRIDLLVWKQRARSWRQAAILITHDEGGGVEQRLKHAARAHATAGRRPIVLRPAEAAGGGPAIAVRDGIDDNLPNLVFAVSDELPALLRLLRAAKADRIEAHHLADHPPSIYDLIAQLGLPYDVHVHDYAWFCPRVSLVAAQNQYCGEPDLQGCERCVADNGHFLQEDIGVAALRSRSSRFLTNAQRVVVPADDVGLRMRRHFPTVSPITIPHEDDDASIQSVAAKATAGASRSRSHHVARPAVCVVGAIGVHKGYDVLLACARDAQQRDLDLEFVVVGHTIDDARMMETGRVFVTGRFDPNEAVSLIKAQKARFGLVPSICPETWCLGLGDLWRAGLQVAAFDIGAPAERIRRTGRGFVLPLGLSANAINNTLVVAIRTEH
jgi:GT2 family glycosyltransferase